ncbi:MAG: prepilin peptidase, partial [Cetobacterium sp.]
LGMGIASLPFSLIYGYVSELLDREVLGYGDVKLAMGIGACLTYTNFFEAYLFFLLSFVVGAVYGIFLLIKIKLKREEEASKEFPFAPFISISGSIIILLRSVL